MRATTRAQEATTGTDTLALARGLIAAAMIAGTLYSGASLVRAITDTTVTTPVDVTSDDIALQVPLSPQASVREATLIMDVQNVSTTKRLAWWVVTDARALLLVAGLELLRRILGHADEPFVAINVRRFSLMAGLAMADASVELFRGAVSMWIHADAGFTVLGATWDLSTLWLAGLLTVMAAVWRHGVALRDENALTI